MKFMTICLAILAALSTKISKRRKKDEIESVCYYINLSSKPNQTCESTSSDQKKHYFTTSLELFNELTEYDVECEGKCFPSIHKYESKENKICLGDKGTVFEKQGFVNISHSYFKMYYSHTTGFVVYCPTEDSLKKATIAIDVGFYYRSRNISSEDKVIDQTTLHKILVSHLNPAETIKMTLEANRPNPILLLQRKHLFWSV